MKNKGFTLMELVIVLTILVLSLSLVASSFSNLSKTVELKAAAKKVSGILRYYRSEAVNKGSVYQVLFDLESRTIRVQSIPIVQSTSEKEEDEKKEAETPKTLYELPKDVQLKDLDFTSSQYPSDLPAIEFYPNGGSNGGSVLFSSPDRGAYRIKVHFLTGMVEIERA